MGFFIIILFVLYLLACVRIYGYACKKTQNKKMRALTIVLLVLIGFGDNIVQLAAFYYFCHTQGGLKIFRTVENAEGYLDEGDTYGYIGEYQDLIQGKYKFVEVEVRRNQGGETAFTSSGNPPIRLPNGKYRYYLAKSGSPHCEYYYKQKESQKHSRYRKNFPAGFCMATERINAFKSQYAYRFLMAENEKDYPILGIAKRESSVRDIRTGEVLGIARSFSYHGSWFAMTMYGYPLTEYPSVTRYKPSIHITLLNSTLIPKHLQKGV
jgi:hypothetical protein